MRNSNDGAGGKYRVDGIDWEESADESAKWSGEETEGSATEEDADTTEGVG